MNFKYVIYYQGKHKFCSVVLPLHIILNNAQVLYYKNNQSDYGYQRRLNTDRIKKIAKYIIENPESLISPSSIILSCNSDIFGTFIKGDSIVFQDNPNNINFRIVDGQHRLYALKEASENVLSLKDYQLNVIIFIVDKNDRYPEVQIFNDINSKGIRVKTDIAILAKHTYALLEKREIDIAEYISVKSLMMINDDEQNVWSNAIKFDVYNQYETGIIGFKAMYEEIISLVKKYIKLKRLESIYQENLSLEDLDKLSKLFIKEIFDWSWDKIKNKWEECFFKKISSVNIYNENEITYYDDSYYIQKTIGAKALHNLMLDVLNDSVDINEYQKKIHTVIQNSNLISKNWRKGDIFTGISSFSGATFIKKTIAKSYYATQKDTNGEY